MNATDDGVVVERFQWIDQAVEQYPSAKLLPLELRLARVM
jgi:hypothetical protein